MRLSAADKLGHPCCMDRSAHNSGTGAVRTGQTFDVGALDAWLRDHVEDYAGPLAVEQFRGGQSNPDLQADHARPILCAAAQAARPAAPRRPCDRTRISGHHRSGQAGLSGREKLRPLRGSSASIGTPFYVMEMVEGRIFWNAAFPEVARRRPAGLFRRDERDHGRAPPDRSRRRRGSAIMASPAIISRGRSRAGRSNIGSDVEAGRVAAMDRLVEWLPRQHARRTSRNRGSSTAISAATT